MKSNIVIIGAGVVGCAIASELSKYDVNITVLEKEEDVCTGTSKANSGIVHAGFDAKEGTLKAKLNVRGSKMMEELSKRLDFPYKRNGALVLCDDENRLDELKALYERGIKNEVEGLEILDKEALRKLEPNVAENAVGALYAKTSGIVCPFGLTIAFAEHAAINGADFRFNSKVTKVERYAEHAYKVYVGDDVYRADYVISATGVYAEEFHNCMCEDKISIVPRKGEYYLLDKEAGEHVKSTIFHLPDKYGKGVLVTPTTHGNLLVGPTADDIEDKEGTNTTLGGLNAVKERSVSRAKDIPFGSVITTFAGLRAHGDRGDFVIEESTINPGFISLAGIESPGLSAAPAIGEMVANMINDKEGFRMRDNYKSERVGILNPNKLSVEEKTKLIKEKPSYGTIVCRCEMITEGEIIDALTRIIPARSLDGVKRRVRAGMGRCQSGFCSPKTMELISKYCNVTMGNVTKQGKDSKMILGKIKDRL